MRRRSFFRVLGLGAAAAVVAPKALVEAMEPSTFENWGPGSSLPDEDFFYQGSPHITRRNGIQVDHDNKTIELYEERPYTFAELHTRMFNEWTCDEETKQLIRNGGWVA